MCRIVGDTQSKQGTPSPFLCAAKKSPPNSFSLLSQKLKPGEISVGRILWIPMQVTEVLHLYKRRVVLALEEGLVLNNEGARLESGYRLAVEYVDESIAISLV